VNNISEADLLVYLCKNKSQAKGNDGIWYFEKYISQSDKKIYFVKYKSQADIKICYVKLYSLAGWTKKDKKVFLK
jgi:hypothetical protein